MNIGDKDLRNAVWRWMPRVLSDGLTTQYNLSGAKGKGRLSGTKLMDVILGKTNANMYLRPNNRF